MAFIKPDPMKWARKTQAAFSLLCAKPQGNLSIAFKQQREEISMFTCLTSKQKPRLKNDT